MYPAMNTNTLPATVFAAAILGRRTPRCVRPRSSRIVVRPCRWPGALLAAALLALSLGQNAAAEPITEFPIPGLNKSPNGITLAPSGDLWFAEETNPKLGRVLSDGTVDESPAIPSGNAAWDITMG